MSWILEWFYDILDSLGLTKKPSKLLLYGLNNVGRTTLLHMLRDDQMLRGGQEAQHFHASHSTSAKLRIGGLNFTMFDPETTRGRRRLKDYFPYIDAIVFLVDATDLDCINNSKEELNLLFQDEQLSDCPIMVLGNKIDKPDALSEKDFKHHLGITQLCTGKSRVPRVDLTTRPLEVFMCSVVKRQGYGEGFRWLSQYID